MTNQKRELVRIVPPAPGDNGLTLARGTKVLVGDTAIPCVFGVTLQADVSGSWTATIRCHCQPPEVSAGALVEVAAPLPRWRRALLRLLGVRAIEVTDLNDHMRNWRTP